MISGGTHGQPLGTWSDDTSMVLCTMQSIVECQGVNPEHIAKLFVQWRYNKLWTPHGHVFDIGGTTSDALENLKNGIHHTKSAKNDPLTNGNGALMRMLPLAWINNLSNDTIAEIAQITHGHQTSTSCCLIYINVLKELAEKGYTHALRGKARMEVISSGYVQDTLDTVLWLMTQVTDKFDPLKQALHFAVELGDDTDTIAALVGSIFGYINGFVYSIDDKVVTSGTYLTKIVKFHEINILVDNFISTIKKLNGH